MKKHLGYYISFFIILAGGVYLSLQGNGDKSLTLRFVGLFAFAYVVWGLLHHLVHHSMTVRIVIEYIVVALLGVAVIVFILNGGV
ncbi:MAG TPA: hypothetical protein VEW42_01315 [Candidatus Eisenbacteria bacterium]|nr:hypothetical protein [Candidatus Eisenbacteria bacterium]